MLHRASVHKPDAAPSALSRIGKRFGSWPAIVFALLSLLFGSAIIVVNPPHYADQTRYRIFCVFIRTHEASFCPSPALTAERESSWSACSTIGSISSRTRGNGSPHPSNNTREDGSLVTETRESATARSWPSIMTSSAREMTRPHKRLCSRRLLAQKATVRLPMLLISSRQPSGVCSASTCLNCCS